MKTKWISAVLLAFVAFASAGCSKNDDVSSNTSIDAAVGTFRGSLEIVGGPNNTLYDKTIVVSKVSDSRIKVVVGDASLNLPDREFNVTNNMDISITSASISTGGTFLYDVKEKSVVYQAEPTAAGEVLFTFKGDKQ
ncbi:hypothetical protein [Sphingobacterium paludis]|uniref:Lipocalin-like domain-containing protein n=1 Tax=Sphingobacterium paludis TaxID=1476465 RepID=A0A4R7CUL0_9SPHI|nr:hypothetical protein [Sphingobacterium paludis]TDS07509.1 hypothetical protein B0I21_11455 [Sphingobacterium paludis]